MSSPRQRPACAQDVRLGSSAAVLQLDDPFSDPEHQYNAGLEDYAKVAYGVVVAQRWTVENGLLTSTLKIKRNALETLYMRNVDAWFASRRRVIWEGE